MPIRYPINIATGKRTNIKKLVKQITELYDYKPKFVYDTTKPTMIPTRLVDVSKAKRILKWTSRWPLKDGLHQTIEWYKQYVEKVLDLV